MLELVRLNALPPSALRSIDLGPPASGKASEVELTDPEGVPLARVLCDDLQGRLRITHDPSWLGDFSARVFGDLYKSPAAVRAGVSPVATPILVDRPLIPGELRTLGSAPLLLLLLAGPSIEPDRRSIAMLRNVTKLSEGRPNISAVARPMSRARASSDPDLLAQVVAAYTDRPFRRLSPRSFEEDPRGTVLFFTGLSGSGKSTIARAVRNKVLERSTEPVTLLDGDLVRRQLSADLGFSRTDREINIRRIGWVAAQVADHGGLVICSPIAPYTATRSEVRGMVVSGGGRFVLIHVSTPLEECARRDRKGLYARAERGEIADFTGASAPYEAPADADLTIDTTVVSIEQARDHVLQLLAFPE